MSVYVVVTKPGYEKIAAKHMERGGLTVFMPTSRHFRRAAGRKFKHDRPLIAGYLFAWSDSLDRDFKAMRHAEGVLDLLGNVDGCWIETLLVCQSFGYFDATLVRRPGLSIGQMVRIIGTMWQGYMGKVVKVDGGNVEVEMHGKHMRVHKTFDAGALELQPKAA